MKQIRYNLLVELEKQNNHSRALAKKLNTNQMSVARALKQLEEDNVVDFKQEGKNKTYFIKQSLEAKEERAITEHKKLLHILATQPRLRTIIEKIKQQPIELAILFGSYAKNTATKESDIDIYIETKDKTIRETIEQIDTKISVKIGTFDTTTPLAKEIIKNHVIIKGVERYHALIHTNAH